MKTYRTVQGDMWDSIAYSQLGSTDYTDRLMNLNPAYRNYYSFPAGIVLTLPEPVYKINKKSPPWKKVKV